MAGRRSGGRHASIAAGDVTLGGPPRFTGDDGPTIHADALNEGVAMTPTVPMAEFQTEAALGRPRGA